MPPLHFLMKMKHFSLYSCFFLFSKAFPLLWRNLIKNFSTSLVLISPIAFLPNLNWQTDLLSAQYECKWKLNWNKVWKMNSKTWLDTAWGEPHERHNSYLLHPYVQPFLNSKIYCWIVKSKLTNKSVPNASIFQPVDKGNALAEIWFPGKRKTGECIEI